PTMRPDCRGSSRMIDSAETDLPDPDSPTMATISPRPTSKDRPSTARRRPDPVTNSTSRLSTDNSVGLAAGGLEPGTGPGDGVVMSGVKALVPPYADLTGSSAAILPEYSRRP